MQSLFRNIKSALLLVFLLAAVGSTFGQAKKKLQVSDYGLWGTMFLQQLSDYGNWTSYAVRYDSGKDTLFVKNTGSAKKFAFPKAGQGVFSGERYFACQAGDTLIVHDLQLGSQTRTPNIRSFAYASGGKYLLLFFKETGGGSELVVKDLNGNIVAGASQISSYALDATGSRIALCTSDNETFKVELLHLGKPMGRKTLATATAGAFGGLLWKGGVLAFLQPAVQSQGLFAYNCKTGRLDKLEPATHPGFPKGYRIAPPGHPMTILEGGRGIAFRITEINAVNPAAADAVQLWHADDKKMWSERAELGAEAQSQVLLWTPETGRLLPLTSTERTSLLLDTNGNFALSWDPSQNEPQPDYTAPSDIYLTDLESGQSKLLIDKLGGLPGAIRISSTGRYIAYPKGGRFFVYDTKTGTHTDVSKDFPVAVFTEDYDRPDETPAYGSPGWTTGDKTLLLYDRYDIWEVSSDGRSHTRLTKGREQSIRLRIAPVTDAQRKGMKTWEASTGSFDLSGTIALHARQYATGDTGYFLWSRKKQEQPLVFGAFWTDKITKAAKTDAFVFTSERFDNPPAIYAAKATTPHPVLVEQSNPQHYKYEWGKPEQIDYTVNDKPAKGALFYPAGYKPGEKYPMIVEVYENLSPLLHHYVNPSLKNGVGTNIANFTTQGYAVLLPDIVYEMREMGASATRSVLAAVDAAIAKGVTDPDKVGLTGHSFGGYETNFIISQTNRFAAAVSGAAINDLVSSYLYVSGTTYRPDYYRYESDQQRMGKSLFEDPESYLRNSTVMQAAGIQTPLLSFTGAADLHVHYFQTMELYLALRRLKKTHSMLIYPREQHVITEPGHDIDLTQKVSDWFAHYLKGEKPAEWMNTRQFE